MKAQFFIISSVIIIYIITLSFQYLTSFSDIKVSKVEEQQEFSYIPQIKYTLLQNYNESNYINNGNLSIILKDINSTKNFLNNELLKNGIDFDSKFIFFSNGFETGNMNNWTNVFGAPSVDSGTKYGGNYSLYSNGLVGVIKKLSGVNEVYARVYVNFKTLPSNSNTHYFLGFFDHGNQILTLGLENNNNIYKLEINSISGGLETNPIGISNNEWHYYDVYWYGNVFDPSSKTIRLWYDGNLEINQTIYTGVSGGRSIDEYRFGGVSASSGNPDLYTDCVAIGSDYIGGDCYPDEQPYFVFSLKTNEMYTETDFPYYSTSIIIPPAQPLSIDSHTSVNSAGTSGSVILTTTKANDTIILFASNPSSIGTPSTTGLTWILRNSTILPNTNEVEYYAIASSSGSYTIMVPFPSGGWYSIIAFAVNGANVSNPFDGKAVTNTSTSSTPSVTITTTNSNDMIIGGIAVDYIKNDAIISPALGYTIIDSQTGGGQFAPLLAENKTVSSTQSNLVVNASITSAFNGLPASYGWGIIADAITGGASSGGGTSDTTPPQYSGIQTSNPSTYSSTQVTWMNATWTDDYAVSQVKIESDFSGIPTNYTPSQSGSVYYLNSVLPAGTWHWKSYAVDTSNNWATSTTQTFTISKATPSLSCTGTSNTYPTSITFSGSGCPSQGASDVTCTLTNPTPAGCSSCFGSSCSILCTAGTTYSSTYTTNGGQNWSSYTSSSCSATENKGSPSLSLTSSKSITYGAAAAMMGSASGTGNGGCTYTLYRSGSTYGSGTFITDNTVLAAGSYPYVYNTTGCANYTSGTTSTNTLTVNQATPTGSLTCIGTGCWNSVVSGTSVTIGYSESNGGDVGCSYVVWRDGVNKGSGETWTPAAGSYNYKLNTSGCTNYSAVASMNTNTLIVTPPQPLSIDGHASVDNAANPSSVTLTTTKANDIIILFISSCCDIGTITDSQGLLTWNLRKSITNIQPYNSKLLEYYAQAPSSPLLSDIISVQFPGGSFHSMFVFGVSGANLGSPFDPNAAIPAAATNTGTVPSVTISTSNSNDMIIGGISANYANGGESISPGSGYTTIDSTSGYATALAENKTVSSAQSNLVVNAGLGSSDYWGIIADALSS